MDRRSAGYGWSHPRRLSGNVMKTVSPLENQLDEGSMTEAFMRGFSEGKAASVRNYVLGPYLQVGIDDYARGYRSGFFCGTAKPATDRADRSVGRELKSLTNSSGDYPHSTAVNDTSNPANAVPAKISTQPPGPTRVRPFFPERKRG